MTQSEPLLSPGEFKTLLPIKQAQKEFIARTRQEIKYVLDGLDNRILLIIGPCSIHDVRAAKDYAKRLKTLTQEISTTFLPVMRVYFEKPRTSNGWKGMLYDPHLDGSNDIPAGMRLTRQLLLDLAELEVATATEFLDPATPSYFGDLIAWGCIGARTAASQTHRQVVSGLPLPIAFKNSTDGNIDIAINGVRASSMPHSYIGINENGKTAIIHTNGNSSCHIVLRGGKYGSNYDPESIGNALKALKDASLPERLLIDCSHDNSQRKHERQCHVFHSVINQIIEGNKNIRGLLLESHIFAGSQSLGTDLSQLRYAVSLTDPCIDWATTENLLRFAHLKIKNERSQNREALCLENYDLI